MATINVWKNLKFDKANQSVLKELRTQAQLLADNTEGLLYAEVNPVDAIDELTSEKGVVYNFYVLAPYLGNFRNLLFTVIDFGDKLILVNRIVDGRYEVKSVDELMKQVQSVIGSGPTSQLLSSLYTNSKEMKTTKRAS